MSELELLAPGPAERNAALAALPHVLLVVDSFPKTLGGGERIALRLAQLLPQAGYRASVLTLSVHPQTSFLPEEAPCPVYLLPLRNTYGPEAFRGALALRRFLKTQKVQVVQTFFESSDLWAGLVTRLFSSAKLFWSRRDMGILRQRKHHVAYRLLRHLPHGVFAVSARVADHVVTTDGVARDKVHLVYNGLDLPPAVAQRGPVRAVAPHITTIGNVRPVKGHDVLVEAAARVIAIVPDAQFSVAGDILDEPFYEGLCARIVELGLSAHFRFLGKVTDLPGHLREADVFVLPSRSEGFSNALIEAMADGLPVIATDVGGNAEAIDHGQSGFIVPPEDAEALAQAIVSILQDSALAAELGCAAEQKVAREFTSAVMVSKVAEAFRRAT